MSSGSHLACVESSEQDLVQPVKGSQAACGGC
jgi:hypothetical protein